MGHMLKPGSEWIGYSKLALSVYDIYTFSLRGSCRAPAGATCCCWSRNSTSAYSSWHMFVSSASLQNSPPRGHVCDHSLLQRTDVAKVTFDLYKNNPKDFIGCLNIKATLYGVYSVSYDMRCYAAKSMLRWVTWPFKFRTHFQNSPEKYTKDPLMGPTYIITRY